MRFDYTACATRYAGDRNCIKHRSAPALNQPGCETRRDYAPHGKANDCGFDGGFDAGMNRGKIAAVGSLWGRTVATVPALRFCSHGPPPYADAIRARISSTRHAVTRAPNFTGLGKRPVLTPAHQQDFLTGMIGGIGGSAFGSPMICGNLRKPVSGSWLIASVLVQVKTGASSQNVASPLTVLIARYHRSVGRQHI